MNLTRLLNIRKTYKKQSHLHIPIKTTYNIEFKKKKLMITIATANNTISKHLGKNLTEDVIHTKP